MTKETRAQLNHLCDNYRQCHVIDGPLHARVNEQWLQKYKKINDINECVFVRVTAQLTYMFWNLIEPTEPKA